MSTWDFWSAKGSTETEPSFTPEDVVILSESEEAEVESPGNFDEETKVKLPDDDLEDLKERITNLEFILLEEREENKKLNISLDNNYISKAKLLASFTTYHIWTLGVITVIPMVNCFVEPDTGVVFSLLSLAGTLMLSDFNIMVNGYQYAQNYIDYVYDGNSEEHGYDGVILKEKKE